MVSEISIAIIVSVCDLNIVGRGVFSSNLKFLLLILLYYPCRVFFWLGRWGGGLVVKIISLCLSNQYLEFVDKNVSLKERDSAEERT